MKKLMQYSVVSALALSLAATTALADMPNQTEARQAAKKLASSNRSLSDIIKTAESKTGGTAISVALVESTSNLNKNNTATGNDRSRSYDRSSDQSNNRPDANDRNSASTNDRTNSDRSSNTANQSNADRYSNSSDSNNRDSKLEYRVTCLVNDSQLKDVYVCADTGEVETVRDASRQNRRDREGNRSNDGYVRRTSASDRDVFANSRDRYADGNGYFDAGPDGRYERIVVWHFVPNDQYGNNSGSRYGNNDNSMNRNRQNHDEGDIRTNYDPHAQNHHPANAQNPDNQNPYNRNANNRDNMNDRNRNMYGENEGDLDRPGHMVMGSKLLNASATDAQDQKLGDVEDIVINPDNAKVVYTAVSYGGVLGIGEKHFAIPCDEINRVTQDKVVLDVDKSQLENNPGFEKNKWPKTADASLERNGNRRETETPQQIRKLSEVIGKTVKTQRDETLGEIDDAVIDTSNHKVAYVIVDCADRDGKVAIPCAAIQMNQDACIVRNMTKSRFDQLETFKKDNYPTWSDASWNERAHADFNVQPYWKAQARATRTSANRIAG